MIPCIWLSIAIGMGGSIVNAPEYGMARQKRGHVPGGGVLLPCIAVAVLFVTGAMVVHSSLTAINTGNADTQSGHFLLSHASDETYIAAAPYSGFGGHSDHFRTGKPVHGVRRLFGADQILAASDLHV